jgi:hypothetical protein
LRVVDSVPIACVPFSGKKAVLIMARPWWHGGNVSKVFWV